MESDAGPRHDAAAGDAGSRDAGSADAGSADAGSDAGVLADAGASDAGPPPPPIDWDWEWVNRRPHGNSLHGVDMSSATDGWAVGARGTAVRYRDGVWSVVPTPTAKLLRSVAAIASDDAWAVGEEGALMRWDGTSWTAPAPITSGALYRVWAPSSDFAVAVGYGAFQWNGVEWSALGVDASGAQLLGAHGLSRDDFWIAGRGALLHCVDSTCAPVTLDYMRWDAVHAFADDDVWLAGDEGHVAHWDGTAWSDVTVPGLGTGYALSIHGVAPDDLWIGTTAGVFHFDGDTWVSIPGTALGEARHVGGSGGTVLAVGEGLFHDATGSGLVTDAPDRVRGTVNAIWGTSADDLWLGMVGSPGVLHYDGTDFAAASDPTVASTRTQSIHGTAADDVWFLGVDGVAVHWDGASATTVAMPSSSMYSIFALERAHALAVGAGGIVEIEGGTATTVLASPSPVNAVWAAGLDDAYAVGDGGAIYHFNGESWTAMESPTGVGLRTVWGRSASEVFAAGESGVVVRLREGAWETIPSTANASFNGIALEGADAWLVGMEPGSGAGEIWRFDGTELVEVQPGTAGFLNSIVALPDGELWAAGFFSHVLRRPAP